MAISGSRHPVLDEEEGDEGEEMHGGGELLASRRSFV